MTHLDNTKIEETRLHQKQCLIESLINFENYMMPSFHNSAFAIPNNADTVYKDLLNLLAEFEKA